MLTERVENMDKVSIIVPIYKVEPYLARMFDSLLSQTYTNIEIIPIDDCSPDNSRSVIERYAATDSRVCPIYFEQNGGVSRARNAALDRASGDWICFCDGDDWYSPDFVEKMLTCARDADADYIVCDYSIAYDQGPSLRAGSTNALFTGCDKRLVVACGSISSCTHMIRRSLFEQSGARYPEDCKQYEELPVIPLLASYAKKIGVVDEALYFYYQRSSGGSASNKLVSDYEEAFRQGFNRLRAAIGPGYEPELEYHVIYALFYGKILNMCKNKDSSRMIKQTIGRFTEQYPNCLHNPYFSQMGLFKRLFVRLVKERCVPMLRLMTAVHTLLIH